jgi:hypothetical protein
MWYSNLGKHLFLDISSININTLVPSLYQSVETRNVKVFRLLSQPLPHLRVNFLVISETFLDPLVNRFTRQTLPTVNRKPFFMNILCVEFFCPQKNAQQNAALRLYTPEARSLFWLLKPASEHAHALLLPRRSWSWTMLLPSDTNRKHIASITAVLLPFVTYLLTLPCKCMKLINKITYIRRREA